MHRQVGALRKVLSQQAIGILVRPALPRQFDKARYASIANSIAVANKSSKASGTEIVEGMKRGLSAIATTGGKLTPEQLAGLVGTAIDVGIQPGKSGNFISHLVGTVGSADTAHGKRAKDLQEAAQHLGFGGRQEMAQAMRNNPLESIYKILDGLAKLPEKMKIRVAKDLGQEMWFDEILQMVLAKDKLKSMEKDIATDTGFLDKAALKAVRSMGGAHASVVATAKLAQEKMGGGFDRAFTQISDAILRHADTFNFDSITNHVSAFVDGLRQGFGFKDWGQAVDWLVSKFDSGTIEVWKSWGRGFASGIKSWGESLASAFNIVMRLTGAGNDAESTGKLVANLAALATSLIVVNPMLLLLAGTMALLSSPFATFIASVIALKKALDWVADKMFAAFVSIVDAIKNVALTMVNKVRGWIGLNPIEGSGPSRKPGESQKDFQKRIDDYTLERLKQPTSYSGATDFSGRRRNADLSESFTKFAGKIERAAFMSGGSGSQYAAIGGGSGGGFSYASQRKGISLNGTPLHHAVPGQKLPSFGLGSNGIIRRDKIPSFNGGGGSVANPGPAPSLGVDPSIGAGLSGNAYLAARRARFKRELDENPELKKRLAALIDLENPGAGTAVAESLMNRMDMNGRTIASGIGGGNRSFYGPVRRGLVDPRLRELERNPAKMTARMRQIDEALAGSNQIKGHTDQGSAGDPNYIAGGIGININRERFNDWGGGRWGGKTGHAASKAYREDLMRRIQEGASSSPITSQIPSPADAVQSVPLPIRGDASLGLVRGSNGSGGPIAIHINGNSHDPEALATLVQRRIDESMNWRTHDTSSEYT